MRKELDKQIDKFKEDLKKNRFSIHSLEKDRDRWSIVCPTPFDNNLANKSHRPLLVQIDNSSGRKGHENYEWNGNNQKARSPTVWLQEAGQPLIVFPSSEIEFLRPFFAEDELERWIRQLYLLSQVTENSTKLKQQENLFEAARQEKNEFAKNLMDTKDMLAQYTRKCEVKRDEEQLLTANDVPMSLLLNSSIGLANFNSDPSTSI